MKWMTAHGVSAMVSASKSGKMVPSTRASGRTIRHTEKELSGMQMAIFMKESSETINQMATECSTAQMARSMKGSG